MGFMNFAFIGMIIFPIIVLLYYFFRKKYTKKTVSSTLFWEEIMQETKASPYLKKLQKNALLFLQLAALLLLVLALMNPYIASTKITGEQVISKRYGRATCNTRDNRKPADCLAA